MAQFDYGIIGAPAPRAKVSLLGSFNQGRDAVAQDRYKQLLGDRFSSMGGPINEILAGMSRVDPAKAVEYLMDMELANIKKKQQEPATKVRIRELEQLWKDATRSLNYSRQTSDTVGIAKYTELINNLEAQLKEIAPDTWAYGPTPDKTDDIVNTTTDDKGNTAINTKAIKQQLLDTANPKSGFIQNETAWKDQIEQWRKDSNLATDSGEYKEVVAFANNYIAEIRKKFEDQYNKVRELNKVRYQQDADYQQLWETKSALQKDPSVTNKRAAINVVLRNESGAAIANSEFDHMMALSLHEDKYIEFKKKITSWDNVLLGMANSDARDNRKEQIAEEYLKFVDANRLAKYMDNRIPSTYYKKQQNKVNTSTKKKVDPKPNREDYPTITEYLEKLREWKARNP